MISSIRIAGRRSRRRSMCWMISSVISGGRPNLGLGLSDFSSCAYRYTVPRLTRTLFAVLVIAVRELRVFSWSYTRRTWTIRARSDDFPSWNVLSWTFCLKIGVVYLTIVGKKNCVALGCVALGCVALRWVGLRCVALRPVDFACKLHSFGGRF